MNSRGNASPQPMIAGVGSASRSQRRTIPATASSPARTRTAGCGKRLKTPATRKREKSSAVSSLTSGESITGPSSWVANSRKMKAHRPLWPKQKRVQR